MNSKYKTGSAKRIHSQCITSFRAFAEERRNEQITSPKETTFLSVLIRSTAKPAPFRFFTPRRLDAKIFPNVAQKAKAVPPPFPRTPRTQDRDASSFTRTGLREASGTAGDPDHGTFHSVSAPLFSLVFQFSSLICSSLASPVAIHLIFMNS